MKGVDQFFLCFRESLFLELKAMKFINSLQSFSIAAAVFFGGRLFITAIKLHVKIIGGMRKKNQWACQNLHFFRANLRMTNSRTSVQQLKVVCLEFIREHLMESNRHVVVAVNVHSTPYYLFDITLLFLQICLPT